MSAPVGTVREDFDGIARALGAAGAGNELSGCERALLGYFPAWCDRALEVGCGDGVLARRVAPRARAVLALDLSPGMIRLARRRSAGSENIEFRVADVSTAELPVAAFDVVYTVATLHHVPLALTVERLAAAVRPGGLLLIQDLVRRPGLRYLPLNALAWAARRASGIGRRRHGQGHGVVAALYRAHGRGEVYLTPGEARRIYGRLLPGCRVVHHLLWRYTVQWRRPAAA